MHARPLVIVASLLLLLSAATPSFASYAQAGSKIKASDATGSAPFEGYAVALSTDGSTAVVGGYGDGTIGAGATWVYTRSGNTWSQQGAKLIGTGGVALQGSSVAVSADGNTMAEGANAGVGAAWVFTRTAGAWTQQGSSLLGAGAVGSAQQGQSIALSADGNTMLLGGWRDNTNVGAAWVFTRTAGVWSQQGTKLVGSGAVGASYQGVSVALSADGNTAAVGGLGDPSSVGAVWVFTRSSGVWSQQGAKLVGTGAAGASRQGNSVALSADGNTLVVGGSSDNGNVGATWVFTRSSGVWSQQGVKLVGNGAVGLAIQGTSVAVSSDGNTLVECGTFDNNSVGAAWVFARSGGVWSQVGNKLAGSGVVNIASQGQGSAISGDAKTILVGGYLDNSNIGAVWTFVEASPKIVTIHDVPNDQGGKVNVRWSASLLDVAPLSPIDSYWLWRQVPIHAAVEALAHGATLLKDGDRAMPAGRTFRMTTSAADVYYWEFVASQVAHGFPAYSYTASTLADSVPGSNPYTLFMVEAERASTGEYWSSPPDSGYSVDNLPPGPPAPVAAAYSAGATHLHWGANVETDLAMYRVYRGGSAGFIPGPGNRIAAQPDTGYTDVGAAGSYYKISAVDAHGNESVFAIVSPNTTTDVGEGGALGFALEGARPNPAMSSALNVAFELPSGASARLELLDMSGRRVLSREVGTLGAGRHAVNLAEGRRVAPGIYWVRLTQGANRRGSRVAVIE